MNREDKIYKVKEELKDYVQNILTLAYYHCHIGSGPDSKGEYRVVADCGDEIFQRVLVRAQMMKRTDEIQNKSSEFYFVAQSEYDNLFFRMELERRNQGKNMILVENL